MKVEALSIPDVKLVTPQKFGDARGFFSETWQQERFAAVGVPGPFIQDNHALSTQRGVLRGLHLQVPPSAQGKLVRVTRGEAFDAAVDIRRSSPRFGQWFGAVLSESNRHLLWIPPGFAHGYLALSDEVDFVYKCTDFYAPQHERAIRWNDPTLRVQWPLPAGAVPVLSSKDSVAPAFREAETYP